MSIVSITKAQVPVYLVGSDFYNSLSSDDDEEFSIPSIHLKMSPNVHSPSDLCHLLHTVQFWGLPNLPYTLFDYMLLHAEPQVRNETADVLRGFQEVLPLAQLYEDFQDSRTSQTRLDAALNSGNSHALQYLIDTGKVPIDTKLVKGAAENGFVGILESATDFVRAKRKNPLRDVDIPTVAGRGHGECLRFVLENAVFVPGVCLAAAENGHLVCLALAHSHGCKMDYRVTDAAALQGKYECLKYALEHECPRKESAAVNALTNGHINCLILVLDQGVQLERVFCSLAAQNGDIECLKLLLSRGCPFDTTCAIEAAKKGWYDFLRFAVHNGCPVNDSAADEAAAGGHLQCWEYLHEQGQRGSLKGVLAAAEEGHLECVRLMRTAGVMLSDSMLSAAVATSISDTLVRTLHEAGYALPQRLNLASLAVQAGNSSCLRYLCAVTVCVFTSQDVMNAVRRCDLPTLQVLHEQEHGCTWSVEVSAAAARSQSLAMLKFVHEHGCPWDETTTDDAARCSVECLRYAVENGCPLSAGVFEIAAEGISVSGVLKFLCLRGVAMTTSVCEICIKIGHLDCLCFAAENGATLSADLCIAAVEAQYGELSCLKCLRERGCPWDASVCTAAVKRDKLPLLKYLHENGCPWDITTTNTAASSYYYTCLAYMLCHGAPRDASTCAAAARHWSSGYLQMLHEAGCPWDVSTTTTAAKGDQLELLQYAHEHGCPWDGSTSRACAELGASKCLRYCVEHGCPIEEDIMVKFNMHVAADPADGSGPLFYFP